MLWSNEHPPLVTAARLGDSQIITLLLDAGAEVDRGLKKITPLMYASYFGHLEAARTLIARGATAKAEAKTPDRSANKVSAIRFAAAGGHIDLVKLLWDSGVPAKDKNSTLLVNAAAKNDVPVIQLLLTEGVDVNLPDPLTDKHALEIAARNANAETVAVLVGAGATVDFGRKLSPLWNAVYGLGNLRDKQRTPELVERYVRVAKILLAAGARPKAALEWQTDLKKCVPLVELLEATAKK
jgi:ankyrin repeat protein